MTDCILHDGPLADELVLHHMCGVKHCLNPEHMRVMTRGDHMRLHDAWNAEARSAASHCKHGHEFTEENTYRHSGRRHCRTCRAAASAKAAA